jgi:anthranilate synthase component 2
MKEILLIDNYDSFTYNLVHLIEKVTNYKVNVKRNDAIDLDTASKYHSIVLSPGPGLPSEAGIMPELIQKLSPNHKIFGVCLGMQAIAECFGGKLINLSKVFHGVATPIKIVNEKGLFHNCKNPFLAGRYHSWVADPNLPESLECLAVDNDGRVMALKHRIYNVSGVQFHPESILSECGEQIVKNWITS